MTMRTDYEHNKWLTQESARLQAQSRAMHEKADRLFAACLQFLISEEEQFLQTITTLSAELLAAGYQTSFQHRRKALLIRNMFSQLSTLAAEPDPELDKLVPRPEDVAILEDVTDARK